jgi:hypothetical protein
MAERERPANWEDWKWLHRWPRLISIEWALEWLVYWCRGLAFFEVLEFAGRASVLVRVSTLSDTVGEFPNHAQRYPEQSRRWASGGVKAALFSFRAGAQTATAEFANSIIIRTPIYGRVLLRRDYSYPIFSQ